MVRVHPLFRYGSNWATAGKITPEKFYTQDFAELIFLDMIIDDINRRVQLVKERENKVPRPLPRGMGTVGISM